MQSVV